MIRLVPVLLLAACVAPVPADAFDEIVSRGGPWPEFGVSAAVLDGAGAADVWAKAVVRQPPGLSLVKGGLPVVSSLDRPVTGRPWTMAWTTRPTAAINSDNVRFPTQVVALIASQAPTAPGEIPNTYGAWLQVRPQFVIHPSTGGFFTSAGGVSRVDITWPHAAAGSTWFLQLLVRDPRTPAGLVVSPAVELIIGNK
jgi:hypothetical protein